MSLWDPRQIKARPIREKLLEKRNCTSQADLPLSAAGKAWEIEEEILQVSLFGISEALQEGAIVLQPNQQVHS